jgi:hypothetical protein
VIAVVWAFALTADFLKEALFAFAFGEAFLI